MTGKTIHGIDGVLAGLISTASETPLQAIEITRPARKPFRPTSAVDPSANKHSDDIQGARRGRPLGRHDRSQPTKDKVTLRISSNLATEYRDWSWEARCSLSGLVEKALVDYRRNRRP
jgi:hypothetical protein